MINDLILITVLAVAITYFVEWSGLVNKFKRWLFYLRNYKTVKFRFYRIKPIDCSGCFTFWVTLITMICTGHNLLFSILYGLAGGGLATILAKHL